MSADEQSVAVKKLGDHGKPGTPGHAVELEVTVSRRQVFKIIVPFLVASIALGAQNEANNRHEMVADNE